MQADDFAVKAKVQHLSKNFPRVRPELLKTLLKANQGNISIVKQVGCRECSAAAGKSHAWCALTLQGCGVVLLTNCWCAAAGSARLSRAPGWGGQAAAQDWRQGASWAGTIPCWHCATQQQ